MSEIVKSAFVKNSKKLNYLLSHKEISREHKTMITNYKKKLVKYNDEWFQDKYIYTQSINKDLNKPKNKRLYAGGSLQFFEKNMRAFLCEDLYLDCDFVNSHPRLLYNICVAEKISCPYLKDYCYNKKEWTEKLIHMGYEGDTAKRKITFMLNGEKTNIKDGLKPFKAEIDNIRKEVLKIYTEYNDLNSLLSDFEFDLMRRMEELVELEGYSVDVLIHDGFLVRREFNDPFDIKEELTDILEQLSETLKEEFNLELFDMIIKPFNHHYDDYEDKDTFEITNSDCADALTEFFELKEIYFVCEYTTLEFYYFTKDNVVYTNEQTDDVIKLALKGKDFKEYLETKYIIDNLKPLKSRGFLNDTKALFSNNCKKVKFDENPNLIAFTNGVLNTRTGEFRDGQREDFLTRKLGYDYNKSTDKMISYKFINSLFDDPDTTRQLLQVLSTSLTGEPLLQQFFFFSGNGSNGKSKLTELHQGALEDFCGTMNGNFFCEPSDMSSRPLPELRSNIDKFSIITNELDDNSSVMNSKRVKSICGGDLLTVRGLHEKPVKFRGNLSVFLCCNDIPTFSDNSYGFYRRIKIFNFELTFQNKPNPKLQNERLAKQIKFDKTYYQSYINLLLENLLEVRRLIDNEKAIEDCKNVKEATKKYFDCSVFNEFVETYIEITGNETDLVKCNDVYNIIKNKYADQINYKLTDMKINKSLYSVQSFKGIKKERRRVNGTPKKYYYVGIKLLQEDNNNLFD